MSLSSFATAEEINRNGDIYTRAENCEVSRVYKVTEMKWPEINLKKGNKVSVWSMKKEPANLIVKTGETQFADNDDDLVEKKESLSGHSYSIMPNSGEWLLVLEIVNNRGLLNYMQTNGDRQVFEKLAELKCVR